MPFFNCKTLGSFFWKSDRHFFPSRFGTFSFYVISLSDRQIVVAEAFMPIERIARTSILFYDIFSFKKLLDTR